MHSLSFLNIDTQQCEVCLVAADCLLGGFLAQECTHFSNSACRVAITGMQFRGERVYSTVGVVCGSGLCFDSETETCAVCTTADRWCAPVPENALSTDVLCGWECVYGYVWNEEGTPCVIECDELSYFSMDTQQCELCLMEATC